LITKHHPNLCSITIRYLRPELLDDKFHQFIDHFNAFGVVVSWSLYDHEMNNDRLAFGRRIKISKVFSNEHPRQTIMPTRYTESDT